MNISVIGCGAIGSYLAVAIAEGRFPGLQLAAVSDTSRTAMEKLSASLPGNPPCMELDAAIDAADLVIEVTTKAAMPGIVEKTLCKKKHVLVMSVGGFVDAPHLIDLAKENGVNIFITSGALAGIDAILAAREAGLQSVKLTTTKNPRSLIGAPYLKEHNIDLSSLTGPKIIFEGSAREAVNGFPSNANVAITLSLAGIGMDDTKVCFIADPACQYTRQEIQAVGEIGTIHTVTEGRVAPTNPKSGYLAILSCLAKLRALNAPLKLCS